MLDAACRVSVRLRSARYARHRFPGTVYGTRDGGCENLHTIDIPAMKYEIGALLITSNEHYPTVLDLPPDVLVAAAIESQLLSRIPVSQQLEIAQRIARAL